MESQDFGKSDRRTAVKFPKGVLWGTCRSLQLINRGSVTGKREAKKETCALS